jgi:hypothetical protein
MRRYLFRLSWMVVFCLTLSPGCKKTTEQSSTEEEKSVRDTVVAFQAALKARDADKLWSLLDSDSQADAERAAKAVRDTYTKATAEQKAKQEEALGLAGAELAELTGKGFLKTNLFHGEYDEVPDSTIDKVTVEGNKATAGYTEEDGDKKNLYLIRQEGKWKLSIGMPQGVQD